MSKNFKSSLFLCCVILLLAIVIFRVSSLFASLKIQSTRQSDFKSFRVNISIVVYIAVFSYGFHTSICILPKKPMRAFPCHNDIYSVNEQ